MPLSHLPDYKAGQNAALWDMYWRTRLDIDTCDLVLDEMKRPLLKGEYALQQNLVDLIDQAGAFTDKEKQEMQDSLGVESSFFACPNTQVGHAIQSTVIRSCRNSWLLNIIPQYPSAVKATEKTPFHRNFMPTSGYKPR